MAKNISFFRAPFDETATLLMSNRKGDLVPFKIGSVMPQLNEGVKLPSLNLSVDGLSGILGSISGAGGLIDDLGDILKKAATLDLQGVLDDLFHLAPDIAKFAGQQLGVGLSLLALVQQAPNDDFVKAVTKAYQAYFFDPNGYTTLEGGTIAAPTIDPGVIDLGTFGLSDLRNEVRKYASHKTAEQYVRDLIRLTVEASGNELFKLEGRYARLMALTGTDGQTRQAWFRGYASLAESTVTSAVEQAALGVSNFSTNPLIAASLGTFAGTAARKATQDVYLSEIGL
jgi:hypothetical protein